MSPESRREAAPERSGSHVTWVLTGLYLFGISFGFVEAAVVVNLRLILAPSVDRAVGHPSDDLLPMIPFDRLVIGDRFAERVLRVEVAREAATLALLAGVGLAAGRSFIGRFSAFIVGFGVWDLTYYLFLRLLIGWPASLWTWDVLFLIPVPWAAPVIAPALVAATLIAAGSIVIVEEAAGRPFRVSRWDWLAIVAGGLILIAAFCWDWRNIAAGGMPNPFPWPLFFIGEGIGIGGFMRAWRASRCNAADPRESREDDEFPAGTQRVAETQRRPSMGSPVSGGRSSILNDQGTDRSSLRLRDPLPLRETSPPSQGSGTSLISNSSGMVITLLGVS